MRRVVVTGLGVVSPVGNDLATFWDSLKNGRSGIGRIQAFDTTEYGCKIAGEVKNFDPAVLIDRKESRRMDRFTQFAVVAADEASRDSGLEVVPRRRERTSRRSLTSYLTSSDSVAASLSSSPLS